MKRSWLMLTALTLVFGGQSIRVLLPTMTFYWGATLGLSYGPMVAASYAPVLFAWLAPLWAGRFGLSRALRVLGLGLLLCRLAEQFSDAPAVDIWAAMGATACFMGLLPLLYARARLDDPHGLPAFAFGILLGLSLDTALRGLTGTLDLSWIRGAWPQLVIMGLASWFGVVLWRSTPTATSWPREGWRTVRPLVGLGPLLFVEWQILQNQGWVATRTGWPPALAFGWIMLANVGALAAAAYALSHHGRRSLGWTMLPGAALLVALLVAEAPGWPSAFGILLSTVFTGWLLGGIVAAAPPRAATDGRASLGLVFGLAALCLPGLITLYYVSFLVPLLPFSRSALAPLAGAALAACALAAAWQRRPSSGGPAPDWMPAKLGAALLLAPLVAELTVGRAAPQPLAPPLSSVRVMTYNIHGAFGLNGRLDVEAIAQVIQSSGADVIALQELSRGWLINGTEDLLGLLTRRLGVPAALLGPAADPMAGNALLSHYPILTSGYGALPQLDSLVGRGYVWTQMAWGAGEPVLIMNTHLATESSDMRVAQVSAVLAAWAGRPRTVLVGDMNAGPDSPEMRLLLEAGFVDAWSEAGLPARAHIDWIFHTPDLLARDVVVIESPASDHPAVVATIGLRP